LFLEEPWDIQVFVRLWIEFISHLPGFPESMVQRVGRVQELLDGLSSSRPPVSTGQ
jgi:hypothetical protein